MLHQHDLRPLRYQLTRRANGFVNVSNRMAAQDLQLDKIRRDDIAGRQRIAYVEFSHPRGDDAAFFPGGPSPDRKNISLPDSPL